jgi:peptidoglycan/xylan/chitin deacetylase (PgdA/CDA1 family)
MVNQLTNLALPLLKNVASMKSGHGPRGRLSILIYHRVFTEQNSLFPVEVNQDRFDAQMALVSKLFNVIPFSEAMDCLKRGALPTRAACITFDDGYADNAEVALPILLRHNIQATFFVASGYLGNGVMFNDHIIEIVRKFQGNMLNLGNMNLGVYDMSTPANRRQAVSTLLGKLKYRPASDRLSLVNTIGHIAGVSAPTRLMMTPDQVRALHQAGMEIGGHTVTHPILTNLDWETAKNEITENRRHLQEITGAPIRFFAYPNGKPGLDYDQTHVSLVKECGYEAAVTTSRGVSTVGSDLFQLPRYTPWEPSMGRFALQLVRNLGKTTPQTAEKFDTAMAYL